MNITLRKAILEDSPLILAWRNEPTTIPWMGATRPLSFEEHDSWFRKVIDDPRSLFFVIEAEGEPVGQIRYYLESSPDGAGQAAKVSLNLTHRVHGRGIASVAFKTGSERVRESGFARRVFARVRVDNKASIKALENAGFEKKGEVEVHGIPHVVLIDEERKGV
jgi:RimJ/RimL family protein N-acetyltransferase